MPATVIVNVHKGASTFVADQFASCVCLELKDVRSTNVGKAFVAGTAPDESISLSTNALNVRVYPGAAQTILASEDLDQGSLATSRWITMSRDPRDVAVSLYYSKAFSHSLSVKDPQGLLKQRQHLQSLSLTAGIREVSNGAINEFLQLLRVERDAPNVLKTTYEELIGDYRSWIDRVGEHLQWPTSTTDRIWTRTQAELQAPKQEDPMSHKRRVTPGNWTSVFDKQLCNYFESRIGTELEDGGYQW